MLKKRLVAAILLWIVLMQLPGCSKPSKALDMDSFCETVIAEIAYDDELALLPQRVASEYYNLPFDGLEDFRIYVSATSATVNEFAVMKLSDEAALTKAEEAVNSRISNQKDSYRNYRPDQMILLEAPLIIKSDGYLLFSVSNHNEEVQRIFEDNLR